MTTLKSLIIKMLHGAVKEDDQDTIYVIEGGKVRHEFVEKDAYSQDFFTMAGKTEDGTPGPSSVIAIECSDSGDLFYLQISGDGNVAVVTQHERDYMDDFSGDHDESNLSDRGIGTIDDLELESSVVDEESNSVMLSLVDLTPRSGYSLLSLVAKVLQILVYQRNIEEGLVS